jgi:HAD superfamily hydrolase (TIGR01509 family)
VTVRAVLFDFDGTLAPSLPLWVKAYSIALEQYGIVLDDDEVRRRCMFRDWEHVAADLELGAGAELQSRVNAGLRLAFAEAELFPLARQLVEHCRLHGLQTALVTSSPRAPVADVLERLALTELFDFVICGDDVQNYKPHPEPLLTTLAVLQRSPAEAIMIGDSHVDVLAGKAAGTRTALYLPEDHSRFHNAEKLRATQPDHTFSDHSEVPALLGLPAMAVVRPARTT